MLIYKYQASQEEESIFKSVEDVCGMILDSSEAVNLQTLLLMNFSINEHIQQFNTDQQSDVAKKFIRVATGQLIRYVERKIAPNFKQDYKDPAAVIAVFIQSYEKFVMASLPIVKVLYCAGTTIDQTDIKRFFLSLFDNAFVLELQEIFEYILFSCVVDMIKIGCLDITKQQQVSDLLREFGNIMTKLQMSTEESLQYRIEQEFKQRIFDYYEERYQQNYKDWISSLQTPDYLRRVQIEKLTNNSVLKFTDQTILEQVNKILNSHLLTQYKQYLLSDKNQMNFNKLITQYHKDKSLQQIIQLIGDLYGSLDDHYDCIATNFKNIVSEEGRQIMQNKNIQIVEANADSNFSDQDLIRKFQDLYHKYQYLILNCFNIKSSDFVMALNNAFESFINSPIAVRYAEVIIMFSLQSYKEELGKRLINHLQQQQKDENQVLYERELENAQKLSYLFDLKYFQSIKNMLDDIIRIRNKQFIILYQFSWPQIDQTQLNLPSYIITQQKELFNKKYEKKKKNLIWLDLISKVELYWIEMNITLRISMPQAAILLLFQFVNQQLSLYSITSGTGLSKEIAAQNCKILNKMNLLIESDEIYDPLYLLNENFGTRQEQRQIITIPTDMTMKLPINKNQNFGTRQQGRPRKIISKDLTMKPLINKNYSQTIDFFVMPIEVNSGLIKVNLSSTSPEYQQIQQLFANSDNGIIHTINKIQNTVLWERYLKAKEQLINNYTLQGIVLKPQEQFRYLWHGVKKNHPSVIYGEVNAGFDTKYSKIGKWGKGIYFAENASYSRGYSYKIPSQENFQDKGKKVFLCCLVTTGKIDYRLPNKFITNPSPGCGCVQGTNNQIFILYGSDVERAYPAYEVIFS